MGAPVNQTPMRPARSILSRASGHPLTRFVPYVALALLAAAAAQPLANEWLPCTDDAPFHLYRAVELGSLLALGHWFPRWAPHMALGFGYPFFNFYAPLSSYGVVLLHALGLAYPAALRLAFALGLWLAGVGAFLFVRETAGEAAGLAAGAAYLFAPYLAYDVLFRGNLAESAAFIWPPLVLWGLARQRDGWALRPASPAATPAPAQARLLSWGLVCLPYAALILTHNIFALIASPLFAGYAALLAWQNGSWRVLARGLAALAIGIALTAYFWAPALAERDLVHTDRLFVPPIFTWYTNFISPAELLAAPHAEDPALINPSPARGVGLLPVLLALPAVVVGGYQTVRVIKRGLEDLFPPAPLPLREGGRRTGVVDVQPSAQRQRGGFSPPSFLGKGAGGLGLHAHTLFFAAALLGYCLLTLPISTPVWSVITPLAVVQFPWRMLGPAALCAAVLIGFGVAEATGWLEGRSAPGWLAAAPVVLAIGLIYFGNLGWWYPRYCLSSPTASVADELQFEIDSHTIGTTAKGEYIPRTAGGVPNDLTLARAIQQGQEPSRLSLPAGATVTGADTHDPLDARYQITAAQPVTAIYQQFYYPGWGVTLDGRALPTASDPASGLIVFQLPAGTHGVRVTFGSTPLRTAAVAASLITLAGLAAGGLLLFLGRRQAHAAAPALQPEPGQQPANRLPAGGYWLLAVCALLPIIKLGVIDRFPNPLRRTVFDGDSQSLLPGAGLGQHALPADFAGGMRLFGYDLSGTRLAADGAIDVALYVARYAPNDRRYWPAFDIEDAAGLAWENPSYLPPRWQREPPGSPLWPLNQYAQWARRISLLPGTPPGTYQLYGKIFDLDSQQIASVLDASGNAVAPRLSLGTLSVGRPAQPFALQPPKPAAHDYGPIALLGYDLDRDAANAGDTLHLSLFWRSQAATSLDRTVEVSLLGADGEPAFTAGVTPANGLPTSQWRPGDEWRGQAPLRLPANLPTGSYTLTVALDGTGPGAAGTPALGQVRVSAPQRTYQPPPVATPSGATFGGVGVLEGYSLSRTAGSLTVSLVWLATATPDIGYSAFVHLEGADGRVWAQSDAAPANWMRPTTGWLPGEYVVDAHVLNLPAGLPAGSYTLWAGLYDPASGARVPAAGPGAAADQRVALGQVTIP